MKHIIGSKQNIESGLEDNLEMVCTKNMANDMWTLRFKSMRDNLSTPQIDSGLRPPHCQNKKCLRNSIEVKSTCRSFFELFFLVWDIKTWICLNIIQKLLTSYKVGVDVGCYHHFWMDNTSFQPLVEELSNTVKNAYAQSCIPAK